MTINIPGAFQPVDVTFKNVEEQVLELQQVAGYATINLGPRPPLTHESTGLANDATAYTMSVNVDGTPRAVSVVGSAAQTYTDLITEINADISTWATAVFGVGKIVITSLATGLSSTVVLTDGTAPTGLLANLKDFIGTASVTGRNKYLRWDLLTDTERFDVKAAVSLFDPAAVDWTSTYDMLAITGTGITQNAATSLVGTTTYELKVTVDGGTTNVVSVLGSKAATYQQLVDDVLTPALEGICKVEYVQVNATTAHVRFVSPTVGSAGTVALAVGDTNDLIAGLDASIPFAVVNGAAVTGVDGTSTVVAPFGAFAEVLFTVAKAGGDATGLTNDATVYTASIDVDGVAFPIAVTGTAAQTFTTLLAEINADLTGGVAVASIVGGNIRIESASTGSTSSVVITDTDLFATLTNFDSIDNDVVPRGAADWAGVLSFTKGLNGDFILTNLPTKSVVAKPRKPDARGDAVETAVFWDAVNTEWRSFTNDTAVAGNVSPPEA